MAAEAYRLCVRLVKNNDQVLMRDLKPRHALLMGHSLSFLAAPESSIRVIAGIEFQKSRDVFRAGIIYFRAHYYQDAYNCFKRVDRSRLTHADYLLFFPYWSEVLYWLGRMDEFSAFVKSEVPREHNFQARINYSIQRAKAFALAGLVEQASAENAFFTVSRVELQSSSPRCISMNTAVAVKVKDHQRMFSKMANV